MLKTQSSPSSVVLLIIHLNFLESRSKKLKNFSEFECVVLTFVLKRGNF